MTAPALKLEDTIEILVGLEKLGVVLIGGQALNYWASVFREAPELDQFGPYASKDVDFQGHRAQVEKGATLLGGKAIVPKSMDHATPTSGIIEIQRGGQLMKVDFLSQVYGLKAKCVEAMAIPVQIAENTKVLVMHPVHCLQSRVHNVIGLPQQYANLHGLNQLRASVICAREYIRVRAKLNRRPALNASEVVFKFATHQRSKDTVVRHGIEIFEAIQPWTELGKSFAELRYPQMKSLIEENRRKLHSKHKLPA